jgi:hypothetical protein
MSLQGSLSIERMCQMVPVSRRSMQANHKRVARIIREDNLAPNRESKKILDYITSWISLGRQVLSKNGSSGL